MAALKLHRTEEGVGATFPADILDHMKVGEGDTLNILQTTEGILLTPGSSAKNDVMSVARRIMDENAAVLRALAK